MRPSFPPCAPDHSSCASLFFSCQLQLSLLPSRLFCDLDLKRNDNPKHRADSGRFSDGHPPTRRHRHRRCARHRLSRHAGQRNAARRQHLDAAPASHSRAHARRCGSIHDLFHHGPHRLPPPRKLDAEPATATGARGAATAATRTARATRAAAATTAAGSADAAKPARKPYARVSEPERDAAFVGGHEEGCALGARETLEVAVGLPRREEQGVRARLRKIRAQIWFQRRTIGWRDKGTKGILLMNYQAFLWWA